MTAQNEWPRPWGNGQGHGAFTGRSTGNRQSSRDANVIPIRLTRHELGLYAPSERVLHLRLTGRDPLATQARPGRPRSPPGARRLASAAAAIAGNPRALWLFAGAHAWDWWRDADRRSEPALCLPPDDHPADLDWSSCCGRDVLLVEAGDADESLLRDLAERVALCGPRSIILAAECVHPLHCDGYLFANVMPMVRVL
jgi:hypothetical protein